MSAGKRWAEAYERAWRAGDGEAAAALYDVSAVEYWALLVEPNGTESTIAGLHRIRFGADDLVAEARDYWHLEPGHRRPPPQWGR